MLWIAGGYLLLGWLLLELKRLDPRDDSPTTPGDAALALALWPLVVAVWVGLLRRAGRSRRGLAPPHAGGPVRGLLVGLPLSLALWALIFLLIGALVR